MTAVSKNVYFDMLDDIVNKYNNTYHIYTPNWSEDVFVIRKVKNTVRYT